MLVLVTRIPSLSKISSTIVIDVVVGDKLLNRLEIPEFLFISDSDHIVVQDAIAFIISWGVFVAIVGPVCIVKVWVLLEISDDELPISLVRTSTSEFTQPERSSVWLPFHGYHVDVEVDLFLECSIVSSVLVGNSSTPDIAVIMPAVYDLVWSRQNRWSSFDTNKVAT